MRSAAEEGCWSSWWRDARTTRSGGRQGGIANAAAPALARDATVRGGGGASTREEERDSASEVRVGWDGLRRQEGVEGAAHGRTRRRGQCHGPSAMAATRRAREARDTARRQSLVGDMTCVVGVAH